MAKAWLDASVIRKSLKKLRFKGQHVSFDLPLLERVYDLNADIEVKFPCGWDRGIGQMGLLLRRRFEKEGSWCTPDNSLSFGSTGGNGVHFSFLIEDNIIDDQTPVIMSVPGNCGPVENANVILARGFEDFIRLGLHCGYFAMESFSSADINYALEHYARTDWDGEEEWFPSKNHRVVAEYVAKTLNLTRLVYSLDEFMKLQADIKPRLQFTAEQT